MKKYSIVEIFYSIQCEGFWTGSPAVFVRFAGCNLACWFCDTDFKAREKLSLSHVVERVCNHPCQMVVFTGGEPSLQLDNELLLALKDRGKTVHIETNGTNKISEQIDWITFSPKNESISPVLKAANELKIVYTGSENLQELYQKYDCEHYFLQPCSMENTQECIAQVKRDPRWKLSIQSHKYLSIP